MYNEGQGKHIYDSSSQISLLLLLSSATEFMNVELCPLCQ